VTGSRGTARRGRGSQADDAGRYKRDAAGAWTEGFTPGHPPAASNSLPGRHNLNLDAQTSRYTATSIGNSEQIGNSEM